MGNNTGNPESTWLTHRDMKIERLIKEIEDKKEELEKLLLEKFPEGTVVSIRLRKNQKSPTHAKVIGADTTTGPDLMVQLPEGLVKWRHYRQVIKVKL